MKTREFITADELNTLMKGPDGERLKPGGDSRLFFPLSVGRFDRAEDKAPEFPIFREATAERRTVIGDDGNEYTAWVLQTPLVLKYEEAH